MKNRTDVMFTLFFSIVNKVVNFEGHMLANFV
jgi:hypothetical protein